MLVSYQTVALAFTQEFCCPCAHDGRVHTILTGRSAASLHVAQNGGSGLNAGSCLNAAGHGSGMSDALCVDDDVMLFAAFAVFDDPVNEGLLVAVIALRKQNVLRSVRDTAPQCDVAR